VVEISGVDEDGELLAQPVRETEGDAPAIYMAPEKGSRPALAVGERGLAKLERQDDGSYTGQVIRRLGSALKHEVLGIYEAGPKGGRLKPTDKRVKHDYRVRSADAKGAEPGELVLAETRPHHRRGGE